MNIFNGFNLLKFMFRPFMSSWFGLNVDAESSWDVQGRQHSGFGQVESASQWATGSILEAYLLKKLLKPPEFYGDPAPFAVRGVIEGQSGEGVRFTRYRPLVRPRAQASAGQMNTPLDLTADTIRATIDIWEAFTRFTSRADFYLGHGVMQNALARHQELFHRVGRANIFDVLQAGTNTFFGLGNTAIGNLDNVSYDVGEQVSNAVTKMRRVGTKPCDGRYYPAFCNPDIINLIDKKDTGYIDAESFQGRGLYDLEVKAWKGASIYPTNLLPIRELDASAITEDVTTTTGGLLPDGQVYYYKVVGVNPFTGGIEKVTAEGTLTTGSSANTNVDKITMPAASATEIEENTNLVYDVYWGTSSGDANLFLQTNLLGNAAAAVVSVGLIGAALVTSGTTAPAEPATGVKVTPIILLGEEAYGNVWSSLYPYGIFKPAVVGGTPTVGNEVGKIRSVGWSLDQKPVILNQQRMAVIWIGYS